MAPTAAAGWSPSMAPAASRSTSASSPSTRTTCRCWSAATRGSDLGGVPAHAIAASHHGGDGNTRRARGVTLYEVESTIEGDIDLRGILGLSAEVRNGYEQLR